MGYWINANNPIGTTTTVNNDVYYTASVGYGPGSNGQYIRPTNAAVFVNPASLLVLADGIYAGRQSQARLGDQYHRIGYRHWSQGSQNITNVAFADGHVGTYNSSVMPEAKTTAAYSGDPTYYANPSLAQANGW